MFVRKRSKVSQHAPVFTVVTVIEAFSNYHHYHGRTRYGVLFVTLYGLLYTGWHVVIYLNTDKWPYYFESILPLVRAFVSVVVHN